MSQRPAQARDDQAERGAALRALLAHLDHRAYSFVTPTPSVCRRAAERGLSRADTLRGILGWNQEFERSDLDPDLFDLLSLAGALAGDGTRFRSRLRVSRLAGMLFLHSGYPASANDAVFLGPDSYRFARFLAQAAAGASVGAIAEIGCGAGVGGLSAARLFPQARLVLGDINPKALELAAVNAAHAGVDADCRLSCGMADLGEAYDLIVANPPYVAGESGRTYKDGGDMHGGRLSLEWAGEALDRLAPGGMLVLYTGSAILDGGTDALKEALQALVNSKGARMSYEELDPDIFGGELRGPAYGDVERIAAVGAVIGRA